MLKHSAQSAGLPAKWLLREADGKAVVTGTTELPRRAANADAMSVPEPAGGSPAGGRFTCEATSATVAFGSQMYTVVLHGF